MGPTLIMGQPCALATGNTNGVLGCIRSFASRSRKGGPSSLLGTGDATPGALCLVLGSQSKREVHILERVQQRAVKMIKAREHLSSEERLSEVGLFSLVKRRLGGDLTNLVKGPKGGCKEGRARRLLVVPSDRRRDTEEQSGHDPG